MSCYVSIGRFRKVVALPYDERKKGIGESIGRLVRDPSSLMLVLISFIILLLFVVYPLVFVVFIPSGEDWITFLAKAVTAQH